MKKYKYELHCHTSEVSLCAKSDASQAVRFYKERGYDGVVITDHYSPQTFLFHRALMPHKYTDYYLRGYRRARECAGDDFTVLWAIELRFFFTIDDFLIYGADEDFLRNNGNLMIKYLRRLKRLCDENKLILLEAHPFRRLRFRHKPSLLHGCEVYNGKDKGTDANSKAKIWAEKNGFAVVTSGGDFHNKDKTNPGGIITREPIRTTEDLMRILRSGDYELIEE